MTDGEGNQLKYSYDTAGRLFELKDGDDNLIVAYTYDDVGRLAGEDNGNGTYTTYTYDLAGQLKSITHFAPDGSVNSSYVYTYDELGQQREVETLDGTWIYDYDAIGQLTGAVFTSSNPDIPDQNLTYEYDAAGNRIRTVINGETTDYATNNLNQYETAGTIEYDYDDDGNLISKTEVGKTWIYDYDTENRLIRVVDGNGIETLYEYDALGNRIATIHDGERTEYLVDPFGLGDVVAEYDGAGNLVARYNHGIGLVNLENGNTTAFYDANAIGSIVGLTDSSGSVANSYSYLPFGAELAETETISNPFEFVGQWGVMEEANGLDFMRARFYDNDAGRFISPDPIGLNGGDTNLYRYVNNSPSNLIDAEGTFAVLAYPLLFAGARPLLVAGARRALTKTNVARTLGSLSANILLSGVGAVAGAASGAVLGIEEYYSITPPGQRSLSAALNYAEDKYVIPLAKKGAIAGATFRTLSFDAVYSFFLYSHLSSFQKGQPTDIVDILLDGLKTYPNLSLTSNLLLEAIRSVLDSNDVPTAKKNTQIIEFSDGSFLEIPVEPENQARSKGEPHLTTFDGVGYSFQGAGEFTLVESNDGDFKIQVRYVEIDPRATVASAVATLVDGQRVVIDSEGIEFVDGRPIVRRGVGPGTAKVTVDGEIVEIPNGGSITVGNSQIFRSNGEKYTIVYAGNNGTVEDDDDQLIVDYMRPGTINIVDVALGNEKKGQVRGTTR
jgi:RHS repeat-associated protein